MRYYICRWGKKYTKKCQKAWQVIWNSNSPILNPCFAPPLPWESLTVWIGKLRCGLGWGISLPFAMCITEWWPAWNTFHAESYISYTLYISLTTFFLVVAKDAQLKLFQLCVITPGIIISSLSIEYLNSIFYHTILYTKDYLSTKFLSHTLLIHFSINFSFQHLCLCQSSECFMHGEGQDLWQNVSAIVPYEYAKVQAGAWKGLVCPCGSWEHPVPGSAGPCH